MLKQFSLAIATLLVTYLFSKLRHKRFKQYAHLPQLRPHLLWGHLKVMHDFMQSGVADRHPDTIFEEMWASIDRPPIMFVDLRPVNSPMVLISKHDIAEQISRPTKVFPLSTPKSPTWVHMIPLIGETSILGREGHEWKELRKKYNPGFSMQHLWSLAPLIIEKSQPFWRHLDKLATSSEEFRLEVLLSNLTFDIIGAVVLEVELNAQATNISEQSNLVNLFRELVRSYNDDKNNLPWWIMPATWLKRTQLAKQIDKLVKKILEKKFEETKLEDKGVSDSRSIMALSFQDVPLLTPQIISEMSDQVRSFLFAGHDSTTSVLEWAFYELSRTPHVLKALRDELDEVLGLDSDPATVCDTLARNSQSLLPRMNYLNAVVKETLRLHPPASTVRMTKPGTGFTVRTSTNEDYCLDGTIMYSCQSIIQRDPAVYGDTADDWVPERWIREGANIPASAWRPFERGPRGCIGFELANLESRLIIAIVARKYNFTKTGLGKSALDQNGFPILNAKGQYQSIHDLYNTRRMTAQPVDGMKMKVRVAGSR